MDSQSELMQRINYQFSDQGLLKLALTHPSLGPNNNQRLEFLGDAVLQLCVSELVYQLHPRMPEGDMTALRARLVCEDTLYQVAKELQLAGLIQAHPPLHRLVTGRRGILADAVEALLAAVYLDGGHAAAEAVVRQLWQARASSIQPKGNSKNQLQEYYAALGRPEPLYQTVEEQGPAHKRLFTVEVSQEGRALARGQGRSKKAAEQAAAQKAMQALSHASGGHEA